MLKKSFRSLEIQAKNLVHSFGSGLHASNLHDALIDIHATRDYQAGDRKIDSKSSLRSYRLMSKVFNPEKELNILLVLDISLSCANKFSQMLYASFFLTFLAEMNNDKIGLITFSNKVHDVVEPANNSRDLTANLENLKVKNGIANFDCVFPMTDTENTISIFMSDFFVHFRRPSKFSCLYVVFYDPFDWKLPLHHFSIKTKDSETARNLEWHGQSNTFLNWKNNIKTQIGHNVVFLNVRSPNILTPLINYIIRSHV